MEDRYGKYIRLFGTLFLSMVGLLIAFVILLLGIRLLFGLLDHIPWSTYIYILFIMGVPAMLFISIYIIYFRRSLSHNSAAVRYISYTLFAVALVCWAIFLVKDIMIFSKHAYTDIDKYNSWDMIFLAANVATIFLVGVLQALSVPKEKDWMEKHKVTEEAL